MSRKIEKIKGFAMSELLAVCVVVLLIFAILFANYLPLLAEYEVRISYNNVTAQYAAHYVRAVYKEILEHSNATGVITQIDTAVVDEQNRPKSYIKVYNPDIENINNQEIVKHINSVYGNGTATSNAKINDLKQILAEYGIEEIVISTYKTSGLKEKYENGKMEKYIKYLPKYDRSIYTGEDADNQKQLYRITIKTKEFGYASTPILTDGLTPDECLILNEKNSASHGNYFEVVGYHSEKQQCSENVVIGDGKYSNGSKKLVIKSIGAGAFSTNTEKYTNAKSENIKIESISIPKQVVSIGNGAFQGLTNLTSYKILSENITIGDYAFSNTGITSFNMGENDQEIGNVTKIGEYAFAYNEQLESVKVKKEITYGIEAFSNNNKLKNIEFETGTINLSEAMFLNSGKDGGGIYLTIPNNISGQAIPLRTFNKTNIKSLTLEEGIKSIGKFAFSQSKTYYDNAGVLRSSDSSDEAGTGSINELKIPSSVREIAGSAFRLLPIGMIDFSSATSLETIDNNSFEMKSGAGSSGSLIIPSNVTTIGISAFKYRKLDAVEFSERGNKFITISQDAFSHNDIKTLSLPTHVKFYHEATNPNMYDGIFADNSNLKIADWPEKIQYKEGINGEYEEGIIPQKCFYGISGTEDGILNIPSYIKEIKTHAFQKTTNIKEVNFECNNTEDLTIGYGAFRTEDAKNVIVFNIPSRTISIGNLAFFNNMPITINNYSSTMQSGDWCSILTDSTYTCITTETGISMTEKTTGITTTKTINHITTGEGGCVQ